MNRVTLAKVLYEAGYATTLTADGVVAARDGDTVLVHYVDREPTVEALEALIAQPGYHLFVVNSDLLPVGDHVYQRGQVPNWMRLLHQVHFGRIYAYEVDELRIEVCHLRYSTFDQIRVVQWYGPLEPKHFIDLHVGDQESLLKDMPGVRRVAKFDDPTWWNRGADQRRERERPKWYKDFEFTFNGTWDEAEFVSAFQNFAEAAQRAAEGFGVPPRNFSGKAQGGFSGYDTSGKLGSWFVGEFQPQPDGITPHHRRLYEVLKCEPGADLETVKSAWRKRIREVHPDAAGGPQRQKEYELDTVQQAYQELKEVLHARGGSY